MKSLSVEDMRSVYTKIYEAKNIVHGTKKQKPYASHTVRNPIFTKFLDKHVPLPATILDASCGRGYLLRELIECGYKAVGTEFVPSLVLGDLADLPVQLVDYNDLLKIFGPKSFDVVISNDVLEHLESEEATLCALRDIVSISRRWVLISVGVCPAKKYPEALGIEDVDLHVVQRPAEWWSKKVSVYLDLVIDRHKGSWYGFGKRVTQ